MTEKAGRTWRDVVFANRGVLLAVPAVILALWGTPSLTAIAVGVPIALLGEVLRCWAVGYSGVTTRADTVTAPALVTAGPYAYVRNPLYVGNFITAVGFATAFTGGDPISKRLALIGLSLGVMIAVYALIVPHEEAYLRSSFGRAFDAYLARVPAIFPRLTPSEPQQGRYDASVIVKAETRTFVTFGAMLAVLAFKALHP